MTIYYENGDYYSGCVSNGLRKGNGIYYDHHTGLTYNGEWNNDSKNG